MAKGAEAMHNLRLILDEYLIDGVSSRPRKRTIESGEAHSEQAGDSSREWPGGESTTPGPVVETLRQVDDADALAKRVLDHAACEWLLLYVATPETDLVH